MNSDDPDERSLTPAESALATGMFGDALRLDAVRIRKRKWWPFQPRQTVMAPRGHLHFHPEGRSYCACFGEEGTIADQGLFLHEMTHVWQHQSGLNLLLRRHPFSRYGYEFVPGKPFARYGIEQQAEIVRHVFLMRLGISVPGKPALSELEAMLPFAKSR